ncbi:MAG: cysteine desulfurase [Planctomycetaceae bacterium]|nr:cysteine desulfurase [Planctomycetaceae bacterium]
MSPIYLDNNATTPIHPDVAQAMLDCNLRGLVNPESQHQLGRESRRTLESARETIGRLLGLHLEDIHADHLFFTSGGTEANNLALQGYRLAANNKNRLIISGIEHPSVTTTATWLASQGIDVQTVNTLNSGQIDCNHLESLLNDETFLVAAMLANNETGVLQPIDKIVSLCQPRSIPVHVDAVQAIGKLSVDFQSLGATSMAVTAHKIHGPRGIGALITKHEHPPQPILHGGFQQAAIRPGTEAVALAVGFAMALELYVANQVGHQEHLLRLRKTLESGILSQLACAVVVGDDSPRLPHTSNISFRGKDRQAVLMALDVAGLCCSTGSACASGSSEPSPTLVAMGLEDEIIEGALRFSLGVFNTDEEIQAAITQICAVAEVL